MKRRFWSLCAVAMLVVACQAAPVVGPGPGPSTPPTGGPAGASPTPSAAGSVGPASPAPSGTTAPGPSATATAPVAREVVLGSIYNDAGGQVERARVVIDAEDPAFDRELDAAGGAFALRDVPVGTRLTVTASAPGYATRSRTITVRQPVPFVDETPNRVDFGGAGGLGFWYFLTDHPEIYRTEPTNLAREVDVEPFAFTFHFSEAIQADQRGTFEDLVRVVVPSNDGDAVLDNRTAIGRTRLVFEWADDRTSCTMKFALPLVSRTAGAAISVDFDPTADEDDLPQGESGRRLGFDRVAITVDGSGARRTNRVAPFARPVIDEPVPTAEPSADTRWGTTHMTSVRFEPRRDLTPPKVTKVQALGGGEDDVLVVTFDKPVFGFPEAAVSAETLRVSNFHVVYGRVSERTEREAFEAADPSRTGGTPARVELDRNDPYVLILHDRAGSFDEQQRFKLWIDPKVEDVYGAALGGNGFQTEGEL